jgi:DNA (cytosine-5)-methyltransferase 1
MKGPKKFKTIDLFAGIGGIRRGFENTGMFETVYANDFDEYCKPTYDLNFSEPGLQIGDIQEIKEKELPDFDFVLAGFPCQAFSVAGYRQGFKDEKGRGNLFIDIARIIEEKKPLGFLLENVKNLKNHDGGNTYKVIKETLEALGYRVKEEVLNSYKYGDVPQNRERIYIVGFKKETGFIDKFEFPKEIKLKKSFRDLLEDSVDEKYYYNDKPLYERIKDDIKSKDSVYQWRRQYVRENKTGVCPTLTANMGTGGHNVPIIKDNKGIRKLTPLECAYMQGYYDIQLPDLVDSRLYKQMGNSVSVPVIERMAKQILKAME